MQRLSKVLLQLQDIEKEEQLRLNTAIQYLYKSRIDYSKKHVGNRSDNYRSYHDFEENNIGEIHRCIKKIYSNDSRKANCKSIKKKRRAIQLLPSSQRDEHDQTEIVKLMVSKGAEYSDNKIIAGSKKVKNRLPFNSSILQINDSPRMNKKDTNISEIYQREILHSSNPTVHIVDSNYDFEFKIDPYWWIDI